ncbi:MAG: ABC transporter ATP-binding protein [Lentisphaeria bacterium]|jgi:ABC-2 type transport system ATP-binding protein
MDAIALQEVGKTYANGQAAVRRLSLTVRSGEIFGFLGPNGAGKTTTIKMLLGFFPPDAGKVAVLGGDPRDPAVRRRLGYMPETAWYYPFLNVVELLRFYGGLCGMGRTAIRARTAELLRLVGLEAAARRPLREYSKGMLQRAGLAQALLHEPELLILDEPLTGLDPLARIQLRDILLMLKRQGRTVFFSSHELSEAELVCDRVAILRQGELAWCGACREVAGDGRQNLERIFLNMIGAAPAVAGEAR